ncbi:hypothetical protein HA44_02445 [Mixta gaviniae]|nr:hypothetical protein HA44_02445 [Mixta gaviniae]
MPVSTSSLNIRVTTTTDYKTDNTKALQALLQQATHVIIDTVINLDDQIKTAFEGQVIEVTKPERSADWREDETHLMIVLKHSNCKILNLHSSNPQLLQSNLVSNKGGGRQGTIDIQAGFCLIQGCTMMNQVNAVIAVRTIASMAHVF